MPYPTLALGQSGNPATPNKATEESSLFCPNSGRLFLQVSKQAIWLQFGIRSDGAGIGVGFGSIQWQDPQPFLPVVASLRRRFDAVRVWNYTSGAEAQVFATADVE